MTAYYSKGLCMQGRTTSHCSSGEPLVIALLLLSFRLYSPADRRLGGSGRENGKNRRWAMEQNTTPTPLYL
jgi:hypothetical protein